MLRCRRSHQLRISDRPFDKEGPVTHPLNGSVRSLRTYAGKMKTDSVGDICAAVR